MKEFNPFSATLKNVFALPVVNYLKKKKGQVQHMTVIKTK